MNLQLSDHLLMIAQGRYGKLRSEQTHTAYRHAIAIYSGRSAEHVRHHQVIRALCRALRFFVRNKLELAINLSTLLEEHEDGITNRDIVEGLTRLLRRIEPPSFVGNETDPVLRDAIARALG